MLISEHLNNNSNKLCLTRGARSAYAILPGGPVLNQKSVLQVKRVTKMIEFNNEEKRD